MQKNKYVSQSIVQKVMGHLKNCSFQPKSVLVGIAIAAFAGNAGSSIFQEFEKTKAFQTAALHTPENMKTSALFFAARYDLLPIDFVDWNYKDESGWTVAHEAALFGNLPKDFENMHWEDNNGISVAEALEQGVQNEKMSNEISSLKIQKSIIPSL